MSSFSGSSPLLLLLVIIFEMKLFENGELHQPGLARLKELLQALPCGDPLIIMARYGSRAKPLHHEFKNPMTTVDDAVTRIVHYVKSLPENAQGLCYRLFTLDKLSNPSEYLDQIRTKARKLDADTIEQVDEEDKEDRKRESNPIFALVECLKEHSKSGPVQLTVTLDGKPRLAVRMDNGRAREVTPPPPEKKPRTASN